MFRIPTQLSLLLRASAISGSLYVIGNIIDQGLVRPRMHATGGIPPGSAATTGTIDYSQTLKFGIIGAVLHGPYFHSGFQFLDWMLGSSRSLKTVVAKAVVGQVLVSPPFIALFLGMTAMMNGQDPLFALMDKFVAINITSCCIWPFLSVINFRWVAIRYRMVFINLAGIVWNTYLSFATNRASSSFTPQSTDPLK